MDPLSDVMSLLRLHGYKCGGLDVGGELSVRFPNYEGIRCYALVSGQCWLSVEGVPETAHLETGDCILLPSGRPFRLATDLTLTPIDAHTLFANRDNGGIASYNGGGNSFIVGGHFVFTGQQSDILLGVLPPIVHLRKQSDKTALRWTLDRMMDELREPQPGSALVAEYLACMILVQALRLHLAEGLKCGVGWLFALADKQMSASIQAMHDEPASRWTLQKLAARAGMSRTIFASRFKETVGSSPIEYLTRWRMLLAGDRLKYTNDSISEIARSLGYESESAFGKAFKRAMHCSPRQYSRDHTATPSSGLALAE